MRARLKFQVSLDVRMIDADANRSHRLTDLDRYRTDLGIEAIGTQCARSAHAMLHATDDHTERGVDDPDVRIDSHRGGEVGLAFAEVTVEEKAIIEIPIAGEHLLHRLRRLMNRIIVALGDHQNSPVVRD